MPATPRDRRPALRGAGGSGGWSTGGGPTTAEPAGLVTWRPPIEGHDIVITRHHLILPPDMLTRPGGRWGPRCARNSRVTQTNQFGAPSGRLGLPTISAAMPTPLHPHASSPL